MYVLQAYGAMSVVNEIPAFLDNCLSQLFQNKINPNCLVLSEILWLSIVPYLVKCRENQ
jgi:hypothetical protein